MHEPAGPDAAHTAFRTARDVLIRHRADYAAACREFRWPRPPVFNWAVDWFDAIARDGGGDQPALRLLDPTADPVRDQTWTFAELSRRSNQVANWLRGLGVRRGDRILVMLDQRVALWETLLATMKLGAVAVPTTILAKPSDLADRITRGAIRHVVARSTDIPAFAGVPGGWTRIVSVSPDTGDGAEYGAGDGSEYGAVNGSEYGAGDGSEYGAGDGGVPGDWHDLSTAYREDPLFVPDRPTLPDDPMLLYFTSGTTTLPKLVEHTHGSLPIGQFATMYWIGLRPGDTHLNISSPGWAKHVCSGLLAAWTAQACVVGLTQARFSARATLDALVRTRASTFCAPPTVWRALIDEPLGAYQVALREAVSAGEPLTADIIDRVRDAWGITVRDGYGQTEIPGLCANTPGQPVRPGSMGRPLPGYRMALISHTGEPVTDEGELCLDLSDDPLGLMSGYHDDPDRTATTVRGGWYRTGDVARRDPDGYLTFLGRVDGVFKSSDYRISPYELESVLLGHDGVAEVAVVPAVDALRMAVPKAYVRLVPGVSADRATAGALFAFLAGRLAGYKRIRRIEFAELPKTASGKIWRAALLRRERAAPDGTGAEFREEDFVDRPAPGAPSRSDVPGAGGVPPRHESGGVPPRRESGGVPPRRESGGVPPRHGSGKGS